MNDLFKRPAPVLKMTADEIGDAMRKQWSEQEWAILWEVRDSTGAGARRSADAVMMSLWPSRGLEMHGVEIKVSRSDWKREAADPTKAEAIARFCDRWWVHTPSNLIQDLSELPPSWGLREFDGKKWKTVKDALKTEAETVDRPFLAALLRRRGDLEKVLVRKARDRAMQELSDERERYGKQRKEDIDREVKRRTDELDGLKKKVADFERGFGGTIEVWRDDMEAVGRAAKSLVECQPRWSVTALSQKLRTAADALDAVTKMTSSEHSSAVEEMVAKIKNGKAA